MAGAPPLSVAVNIAALLAALWFTFGGLGYRRGLTRLGATLLVVYGAWPGRLWGEPHDLGQFSLG